MTTITFDTLLLTDKLKASGIPPDQAEAIVRAIADSHGQLVTRPDLDAALAPIRTDLTAIKWMMGVLLAGVVSLVLKSFF